MAGRDEQETTVSQGRLDNYVDVWSNNTVDVRALEKEPRAKRILPDPDLVDTDGLTAYLEEGFGATYRISTEDFSPLKGFRRKRKPMTEEEKAALGERLRKGRELTS